MVFAVYLTYRHRSQQAPVFSFVYKASKRSVFARPASLSRLVALLVVTRARKLCRLINGSKENEVEEYWGDLPVSSGGSSTCNHLFCSFIIDVTLTGDAMRAHIRVPGLINNIFPFGRFRATKETVAGSLQIKRFRKCSSWKPTMRNKCPSKSFFLIFHQEQNQKNAPHLQLSKASVI